MKNLEIETIEHKGVSISVKLDYDTGRASLVTRSDRGEWVSKNWLFENRELEYMQGWQDILEAMTVAVTYCQKKLEANSEEKSKAYEDAVVNLLAPELNKNAKKPKN